MLLLFSQYLYSPYSLFKPLPTFSIRQTVRLTFHIIRQHSTRRNGGLCAASNAQAAPRAQALHQTASQITHGGAWRCRTPPPLHPSQYRHSNARLVLPITTKNVLTIPTTIPGVGDLVGRKTGPTAVSGEGVAGQLLSADLSKKRASGNQQKGGGGQRRKGAASYMPDAGAGGRRQPRRGHSV